MAQHNHGYSLKEILNVELQRMLTSEYLLLVYKKLKLKQELFFIVIKYT